MTLDEAIKHAEEVAEAEERSAKLHRRPDRGVKGSGKRYLSCIECAKEHRQFAEWLKELKKLREQTRWISVSERMPEQPYGCLVTVEDEEPMTGQWFENILPYFVGWDGERWNDSDGEQCPFEVIAWMPLPNVYRNGE